MVALTLSILLGLLISLPQLACTARYLPRSVRAHSTYQAKVERGNMPLTHLRHLLYPPSPCQIDGLFYPEYAMYAGLLTPLLALLSSSWHQWAALLTFTLLAMGSRTPLFRLTHWLWGRIPARFCYFISLTVGFMAIDGLSHLPAQLQWGALFLIALDLCLTNPRLWPMEIYTERWAKPQEAYWNPLTRYLSGKVCRVSGLPFPNRTGQIQSIRPIPYAGGMALQSTHAQLGIIDPNGEDANHRLDTLGVGYAYTYRTLSYPWIRTELPRLWKISAYT